MATVYFFRIQAGQGELGVSLSWCIRGPVLSRPGCGGAHVMWELGMGVALARGEKWGSGQDRQGRVS